MHFLKTLNFLTKGGEVNSAHSLLFQYLRGVQSSYGGTMTTFTVTDVLSRSIICSWLSVATATLQISTSRLPCRSPACQA